MIHHCAVLFMTSGTAPVCVDTVTGGTDPIDVGFWSGVAVVWLLWLLAPVLREAVRWVQEGDTVQVMGMLLAWLLLVVVWSLDVVRRPAGRRDEDSEAVEP